MKQKVQMYRTIVAGFLQDAGQEFLVPSSVAGAVTGKRRRGRPRKMK